MRLDYELKREYSSGSHEHARADADAAGRRRPDGARSLSGEPLRVLALQLVVQPHALDLQPPLLQPRRLALVSPVDLGVMFQLALAFEPCVKRLTGIPIAVSIRFQHAPSTVRQNHHLFTIARDANGFDQTLFAQMSKVAVTWTAGRSSRSRRSPAGTTRNAPTVASERLSEPRNAYSRSRASLTIARSRPRGRLSPRANTSRGSVGRPAEHDHARATGVPPIAMIRRAVTCIVPIVVAFTFVMGFGRSTRAAPNDSPSSL